jgi:ATP-dependent protease ClpP protease subunit
MSKAVINHKYFRGAVSHSTNMEGKHFLILDDAFETSRAFTDAIAILGSVNEGEEVYFLIDSPGGVISACVTLITAMRACKGKIIGIVNGMAASCGAIFISNVDELRMGKHAQIMFHGSSSGFIGNTQQGMEDSAAIIEYVKDLCRPALEKGILLEDEFENAFDKKCDVYLTYEQLKERGVLS